MDKLQLLRWPLDALAKFSGARAFIDPLEYAGTGEDAVTLDMPGYRQLQVYTCGFVAGLMVLHHFDPDYPVNAFYDKVRPDPEYGTETRTLILALRACGIGVSHRRDLGFNGMSRAIRRGRPVIVTIDKGRHLHWVVIYGVGHAPKRVYVAGNGLPVPVLSQFSRRQYKWSEFRGLWVPRGEGLICWGNSGDCPRQSINVRRARGSAPGGIHSLFSWQLAGLASRVNRARTRRCQVKGALHLRGSMHRQLRVYCCRRSASRIYFRERWCQAATGSVEAAGRYVTSCSTGVSNNHRT